MWFSFLGLILNYIQVTHLNISLLSANDIVTLCGLVSLMTLIHYQEAGLQPCS
jgi:hypothetical protein